MKLTIDCGVGVDLPSAGVYTCVSTTFVQTEKGYNVHAVELRDGENPVIGALIFTEELSLEQYVNEKVRCTFRAEIWENQSIVVLINMTMLNMINTLTMDTGIKIYLEKLPESRSTILFEEITPENPIHDCVVYIADAEYRRNNKTDWLIFTLIDKRGKMAKCRMFRPENPERRWAGYYAHGDLSASEWGLQSECLEPTPMLDKWRDPSVDICESFIATQIDRLSPKWAQSLRNNHFVESLHKHDADLEIYEVAIAMHLAQDVNNISSIVSTERVIQAICALYLHKMAAKENELLSDTITSTMVMVKYGLVDSSALNVLDTESSKTYLDNMLALKFVEMAKLIVSVERSFNVDSKVIAWK